MKLIRILLLFSVFIFAPVSISAQNDDGKSQREQIFTDKDKDFLQLWYYEQVLKMDLDEDARYDYLALLQYYTYKMRRLTHPKYKYTAEERKEKFDELIVLTDNEMKDYLSEENYKVHKESFGRIIEMVYDKMGWEKN